MHYRLGVRTYVELPELLKTYDLEVPQVRRLLLSFSPIQPEKFDSRVDGLSETLQTRAAFGVVFVGVSRSLPTRYTLSL